MSPCPKIFISALEASGDSHGAALVLSLKKLDPTIEFVGLGGREMERAGVHLLHEMTRVSVLGFGDVLAKYFFFRKIFYRAFHHIQQTKPDLIILIDSPAFNLRLAKKIRRKFPVLYYIAPQIWAWGWRRIATIRKNVDHVLSILPFEEEMYRKEKVPCTFVGHPLLDRVRSTKPRELLRQEFGVKDSEQVIGLLPGSRQPEVERILPIMLKTSEILQRQIPHLKFFLTQAPHVPSEVYDKILASFPEVQPERFSDSIYDIVTLSDFALVASGTATLETALLGTPYFLLYKAGASTFFLGRRLVRIPYIGLVNVLAGRQVVPEFIQHLAQPEKIAHETKVLLENKELREKLKNDLREVCRTLGKPGASERAARLVIEQLSKPSARTPPTKSSASPAAKI